MITDVLPPFYGSQCTCCHVSIQLYIMLCVNAHYCVIFVDVFKTTRPLGTFAAILLTYVASSVLHVSA